MLENKIKTKKIALLLTDKYIFNYNFEFEANLSGASMLKLALEKISKILSMEEANFHFDYTKKILDSKVVLKTFTAKKTLVEGLKRTFSQAKLNLKILDIENLCFERLLSASRFSDYAQIFWLDLNTNSKLLVFADGELQLKKSLELDFSNLKADFIKHKNPSLNWQQEKLLETELQLLVTNLKTQATFKNLFKPDKNLSESIFLLSGYLANFTQTIDFLQKHLAGVKCFLLNMEALIKPSKQKFSVEDIYNLNSMNLNMGLALRKDI